MVNAIVSDSQLLKATVCCFMDCQVTRDVPPIVVM
jgi:hypothetical protein